MFDFNKYDDVTKVYRYNGFIAPDGSYYKVCSKNSDFRKDTHNMWAETFIKEKLNIKEFKFNPTASAIITLSKLSGPADILINCFGYVYYSHEPIYYKPIIKIPNPKMSGIKCSEEQLNTLYMLMLLNNEDTNNPILNGEDEYNYCGYDEEPKTFNLKK